jgi:AcrR family transcriptional regulator
LFPKESLPVISANETDTSSRILDAAEALFMAHGLEATTLRQITTVAKVNLAAVNYHFGSKDALIEAVFRRRLNHLNDECLQMLDRLEAAAGGEPVRPSQIVDAFFGAALRLAADEVGGGATFMRLLSRTYTEPTESIRAFLAKEYAEVVRRYREALFRALPDTPRDEILWRLHFMLGAMSYAVSGADALNLLGEGRLEASDAETLRVRLMSFLLGGLRAPLTDTTIQASRKAA